MGRYQTRDQVREAQLLRQSKFPPDRLAFHSGLKSVGKDVEAFTLYKNYQITFDTLRAEIAKNNYLEDYWPDHMVPEEMMLEELKNTGWRRTYGDV